MTEHNDLSLSFFVYKKKKIPTTDQCPGQVLCEIKEKVTKR